MSESTEGTPVQSAEPSVSEKRKVLQDAGFPVGTRGKLSAEAEAKYAELAVGQPT